MFLTQEECDMYDGNDMIYSPFSKNSLKMENPLKYTFILCLIRIGHLRLLVNLTTQLFGSESI